MTLTQEKKAVAAGIVDFLKKCIDDGTIASDDRDSVDVAIECISDVFQVSESDKSLLKGMDLLTLVSNPAGPITGSETITVTKETVTTESTTVSDEDRAQAETLKSQGNRCVAQQKFQEAVDHYTNAIGLVPTNAIYYSNRSAAYSSLREPEKAAEDARKAIELDPNYSKAYSRLGLALYSLGDAEGSMKAYQKGLETEGATPSEGMKRGFETAKKRVQEDLEASVPSASSSTTDLASGGAASESREGGAPAGGMPNLSNLFGGGGMPDLSSIMNNPQIAQMAQQMMSNPALANIMNSPGAQRLQENVRNGQMPSLGDIMSDPSLAELARSFMGGAGAGNGGNSQ